MLFIKEGHFKMYDQTDTNKHENKLFSGHEDGQFSNGKCTPYFPYLSSEHSEEDGGARQMQMETVP